MTRNERLYLYDILESIEKIQQYTANLTFEDFYREQHGYRFITDSPRLFA